MEPAALPFPGRIRRGSDLAASARRGHGASRRHAVTQVRLGLRENLGQFSLLVVVNAFVGVLLFAFLDRRLREGRA